MIWATSYPLGRYLAQFHAPEIVVCFRAFIAFGFLGLIAMRRDELWIKVSARDVAHIVLLGAAGFCTHNYLMFVALEHTRANTGAVINGAIPVVVMTLDYVLFRRMIGRWSVFGVGVSLVGAVVVVTHGDLSSLLTTGIGKGEGLFLFAITGWAVYTILARPLLERFPPVAVTAWSCLAGGVLMVPGVLMNPDVSIALLSMPAQTAILVVQGIATMGIGFLWYYEGIKALGPMNASAYLNLVPVFGVILAALTINEIPDGPLLGGGVLVIGGLMLVNRAESRRLAMTFRAINQH